MRFFWGVDLAIRAISGGRSTLVSTGTGSGKTECFLYPMNTLADDQMERLRDFLAGTGVRFGIYTGNLKEHTKDSPGERLPAGSSAEDYRRRLKKELEKSAEKDRRVIHPAEENISREDAR